MIRPTPRPPLFPPVILFRFFFNDTATTEIYTLSLHDALPISREAFCCVTWSSCCTASLTWRSEEHTSELQSHLNLVCRLLLEKKKAHFGTPVTLESRLPSSP